MTACIGWMGVPGGTNRDGVPCTLHETHGCVRPAGHRGRHRCDCGVESNYMVDPVGFSDKAPHPPKVRKRGPYQKRPPDYYYPKYMKRKMR